MSEKEQDANDKDEKLKKQEDDFQKLQRILKDLDKTMETSKKVQRWTQTSQKWEKIQINDPKLKKIMQKMINIGSYQGQLEEIRIIPAKKAKNKRPNVHLSKQIQDYLNKIEIDLYSHQAEAIDLILNPKNGQNPNIIIATPTASGKSLAYNIPVFETLLADEQNHATALYLYPLKALAHDQHTKIRNMGIEIGVEFNPNVYDGDTPKKVRRSLRENSRIILSNPFGFHEYIQQHSKWKQFLKNLKFLIIDEIHHYSGILASNVAYFIRRLLRICEYYGSTPQIILSSATIAKPVEYAEKLTGKKFELVSDDGSSSGKKFFILWNPPIKDHKLNTRYSFFWQTVNLIMDFVINNIQTICFVPSHKLAEEVSKAVKDKLKHQYPNLVSRVTSYRGGYLPGLRREIESGLRDSSDNKILAVVSTDALELGIDIGTLESVVIAGYPGTIISTKQQAGRAGRGRKESVVTLVANQHPLDQYFMRYPESFFKRLQEQAIIDLKNRNIIQGHLKCACAELILKNKDKKYFPFSFEIECQNLEKEGIIKKLANGWIYTGPDKRSSEIHPMFGARKSVIVLDEKNCVIEEVSLVKAYEALHPGAVYLHFGIQYIVQQLDLDQLIAKVKKSDVNYYTETLSESEVRILEQFDKRNLGTKDLIQLGVGKVKIKRNYYGYNIKQGGEIITTNRLDLKPHEYITVGTWIILPDFIKTKITEAKLDFQNGLLAVLCSMVALAPMYSMCEAWDIGGSVASYHEDTTAATVVIFDAQEGGIGVSEKIFDLAEDLIIDTYKLIKECNCKDGCPSCILVPRCGRQHVILDKNDAIGILEQIVKSIIGEEIFQEVGSDRASFISSEEDWYQKGLDLNDIVKMKAYFENGLTFNTSYYPYSLIGKAYCDRIEYNYENAVFNCKKAIKVAENNGIKFPFGWKFLGDVLLRQDKNNEEEAIIQYKKAITIDSEYSPVWNALGVLYERQEKFKDAENAYENAIKFGSKDANENLEKLKSKLKALIIDKRRAEVFEEKKKFDLVETLATKIDQKITQKTDLLHTDSKAIIEKLDEVSQKVDRNYIFNVLQSEKFNQILINLLKSTLENQNYFKTLLNDFLISFHNQKQKIGHWESIDDKINQLTNQLTIFTNQSLPLMKDTDELKKSLNLTFWDDLEPSSQDKLILGQFLFRILHIDSNSDFSPAVLQFCIAVENELFCKIFREFTIQLYNKNASKGQLKSFLKQDLIHPSKSEQKPSFQFASSLKRYLIDHENKPEKMPYTMGTMMFLLWKLHNQKIIHQSPLMNELYSFVRKISSPIPKNLLKKLSKIKNDFRNESAHRTPMNFEDAEKGTSLIPKVLDEFISFFLDTEEKKSPGISKTPL